MSDDRDIEVSHDVSSFAAELRRLADALESGSAFTIHIEGEDVTIPEGASFSIAHEREDGDVELEFQATWSVADGDGSEEDDEDEAVEEQTDAESDVAEDQPKVAGAAV